VVKSSIPCPPEVDAVLRSQGFKAETTQDPHYPYAPPPARFDPIVLQNIVEKGRLNETKARKAFEQLDRNATGWLSGEELTSVLQSVEHFGLFEDKTGFQSHMADVRERAKTPLRTLTEERASATEDSSVGLTPRQKEQRDRQSREEATRRAMHQQADRWLTRYAKRTKGRLYFEEFCLLMVQLSLA
jgi:Ca2+-binding EF-hand superfamily protein